MIDAYMLHSLTLHLPCSNLQTWVLVRCKFGPGTWPFTPFSFTFRYLAIPFHGCPAKYCEIVCPLNLCGLFSRSIWIQIRPWLGCLSMVGLELGSKEPLFWKFYNMLVENGALRCTFLLIIISYHSNISQCYFSISGMGNIAAFGENEIEKFPL